MILEQETFDRFGYHITNLSNMSSKQIVIKCDYCKELCIKTMKQLTTGRKYIDKDACYSCRFKKREDVSLARDGVKNSAQRQDVRDKISNVNGDRLKSETFKQQAKKTNLEKYGTEIPMLNEDIQNKHKQSFIKKYGVDNPSKVKLFKKQAAKNMIITRINNGTYKTYDGKTLPQLAKEKGFSRSHFGKLVNQYGIDQALTMQPHESSLEINFEEWLRSINLDYEKQFRLGNRIADFKIGNIIVELDGLYWHSDIIQDNKNYHAEKRELYVSSGYRPFFFREDELRDKFHIIQSILSYHLGLNQTKIFARKCQHTESNKSFFADNHLMGRGRGRIFALSYKDEPVCAIQINRVKNNDYEISRFCCKLNTQVVGGLSKLIKRAVRELGVNSLSTFIDLRYGSGLYLKDMGFEHIGTHLSFKWTNGTHTVHRLKFRGNSGYEKGFYKIWDCGQSKYLQSYSV